MKNISQKTIVGIRWTFQTQVALQLANLIFGIILMRTLTPDDFGVFAAMLIIFGFFSIVRDMGLSHAIIQSKIINSVSLSTVFWIQVIISLILGIILFQSGFIFKIIVKNEHLPQLLQFLTLDFLIGAIGLVPTAILQRNLQFKTLFYLHFFALSLSWSIAIYMAFQGYGVFSLTSKLIIWTSILNFGAFLYVKWKPKFNLSPSSISNFLKFGIPATGNHILSFIVRNTDDLIIGKIIGTYSLGLYNRAYALMLIPIGNTSSVVQKVLFPTWSKLQDNKSTIKRQYLNTTFLISLISYPFLAILAIQSKPIVLLLFGKEWIEMSTTLSILCVVGMLQSVGTLVGTLFKVFNRNKLHFKISLISSTGTISAITIAVFLTKSIEITALVYLFCTLLTMYPTLKYSGQLIEATFTDMIKPIIYPIIISIASAYISNIIHDNRVFTNEWFDFTFALLIHISLYISLFYVFNRDLFNFAVQQFRKIITTYISQ